MKMFKCRYIKGLIFFVFIILSGCTNQTIYKEFKEMEKLTWNRFDFLEFETSIENIETNYDIVMVVRHLPELRIKQLPFNFTIYSPSDEMRSADHVIDFEDSEGNRKSECLYDLCDISVNVREAITFYEPGVYKFRIENKWPKTELPGIIEVGLIIKKAE
jgi:gliding motility-associated lipoprotein GldH